MPKCKYERTTNISVSKQDVLALLHDPKRFLIAGGNTIESSIHYDSETDRWHGTSASGIPILPKPTFTGKFTETEDGSNWRLEATAGTVTTHDWTVSSLSSDLCSVTEKVTFEAPAYIFYPAQWQLNKLQEKTHKNMQEYMS